MQKPTSDQANDCSIWQAPMVCAPVTAERNLLNIKNDANFQHCQKYQVSVKIYEWQTAQASAHRTSVRTAVVPTAVNPRVNKLEHSCHTAGPCSLNDTNDTMQPVNYFRTSARIYEWQTTSVDAYRTLSEGQRTSASLERPNDQPRTLVRLSRFLQQLHGERKLVACHNSKTQTDDVPVPTNQVFTVIDLTAAVGDQINAARLVGSTCLRLLFMSWLWFLCLIITLNACRSQSLHDQIWATLETEVQTERMELVLKESQTEDSCLESRSLRPAIQHAFALNGLATVKELSQEMIIEHQLLLSHLLRHCESATRAELAKVEQSEYLSLRSNEILKCTLQLIQQQESHSRSEVLQQHSQSLLCTLFNIFTDQHAL